MRRGVAGVVVSAALVTLGAAGPIHARSTELSCLSEIAYSNGGNVAVYEVATAHSWQLTHPDAAHYDGRPAWSPDGSRVAFERARVDQPGFFYISTVYTIDADGSRLHRRARGYASPAWSPDGRQLLLQETGVRDPVTAVVTVDGARPPVVYDPTAYFGSWTPDGRVAYAGLRDLSVMNSDGSGRTVLLRGEFYEPRWSPDGTHALVGRVGHDGKIAVVDLLRRRIEYGLRAGPTPQAAWSPDGRWIAYVRGNGVYVRPAGRGAPRRLARANEAVDLQWTSDGRALAFLAGDKLDRVSVFLVPASGGVARPLVHALSYALRPCRAGG